MKFDICKKKKVLETLFNKKSTWESNLQPRLEGYKPTQKDESVKINLMTVANLIKLESRSWNMERLEELFNTESLLALCVGNYKLCTCHTPTRQKYLD